MLHNCWHTLFSNYLPWEAIEQIRLWAARDLSRFEIHLNIKLRRAWDNVFGAKVSPKKAIERIIKDWWPAWERVSVENVVKLGLLRP